MSRAELAARRQLVELQRNLADVPLVATPDGVELGQVQLDHQLVGVCTCGRTLYLHKVDTERMATDDGTCPGYQLAAVRARASFTLQVPVADGRLAP